MLKKSLVELAQSRARAWERYTFMLWQRVAHLEWITRCAHSRWQVGERQVAGTQMDSLIEELEGERGGDGEHGDVGEQGGEAADPLETGKDASHKAGKEREMENHRNFQLAERRENGLDTTIDRP